MPAHSFQLIDYVRFATLTPSQKAAARKLHQEINGQYAKFYAEVPSANKNIKPVPLIDCWFLPEGEGVCDITFFECDPLANSPCRQNLLPA